MAVNVNGISMNEIKVNNTKMHIVNVNSVLRWSFFKGNAQVEDSSWSTSWAVGTEKITFHKNSGSASTGVLLIRPRETIYVSSFSFSTEQTIQGGGYLRIGTESNPDQWQGEVVQPVNQEQNFSFTPNMNLSPSNGIVITFDRGYNGGNGDIAFYNLRVNGEKVLVD